MYVLIVCLASAYGGCYGDSNFNMMKFDTLPFCVTVADELARRGGSAVCIGSDGSRVEGKRKK